MGRTYGKQSSKFLYTGSTGPARPRRPIRRQRGSNSKPAKVPAGQLRKWRPTLGHEHFYVPATGIRTRQGAGKRQHQVPLIGIGQCHTAQASNQVNFYTCIKIYLIACLSCVALTDPNQWHLMLSLARTLPRPDARGWHIKMFMA